MGRGSRVLIIELVCGLSHERMTDFGDRWYKRGRTITIVYFSSISHRAFYFTSKKYYLFIF